MRVTTQNKLQLYQILCYHRVNQKIGVHIFEAATQISVDVNLVG